MRYSESVQLQAQNLTFMPQALPVSLFDYASLDSETCQFVQEQTGEIRLLMRRTAQGIIEVGQKLIEVKQRLGHGHFLDWLAAEFEWTERTARRFMTVAEKFGTKSDILSSVDVAPTALYLLAAPSTPETAREEALVLAQRGEAITPTTAKQLKQRHSSPTPQLKRTRKREKTAPIEPRGESQTASSSSSSQETNQSPSSLWEIVAIRPQETLPENPTELESSGTAAASPGKSPSLELGNWWHLGKHLLYCGNPNSSRFKTRLPKQVALSLAFPTNRRDCSESLSPQAKSALSFFTIYPDLDLSLLKELVERSLLLCTESEEVVVFSFLPEPALLLMADELDCRCFIAEPDGNRCQATISAWQKRGEKVEKVSGLRF